MKINIIFNLEIELQYINLYNFVKATHICNKFNKNIQYVEYLF